MKKIYALLFCIASFYSVLSQSTDAALTTQSNVIRNETTPGGNTKARIADMYQGLIDSKVSILAPRLGTSSTINYVWTATDGLGNGRWQVASGGGGGGGAWGSITGTLSAQTDLQTALNAKQVTLVSGTNIKTVGGTSLLGSGDIPFPSTGDMILASAQTSTGKKSFTTDATNAGIRIIGAAADPSAGTNPGDLWYRTDTEKMSYYGAAGVRLIVVENLAQTLTSKTLTSPVINTQISGDITTGGNITTTNYLIGATATQTLSAKTLTSPIINTQVTTASTSIDLWNTTATTVNFTGAATTIAIGAATGTMTLNNATIAIPNVVTAVSADFRAILKQGNNLVVTALSGFGTTTFLRADGTWAAPSGGGITFGGVTRLGAMRIF